MSINLNHIFHAQCFDRVALFSSMDKVVKGVPSMVANKCTVTNYMERVKEQAHGKANEISNGLTRFDPDKYIGNGFEILVECIVKFMGGHPAIGIVDYEPISKNDNGVDGVGKCIYDMQTSTVQAKYRSNPYELLSADRDRLSMFFTNSTLHHGVKPIPDGPDGKLRKMLVITSSNGLAHHTKEVIFRNNIRCLGNEWLKQIIDGNLAFWLTFRNAMGD
jgi:hypothetical protein